MIVRRDLSECLQIPLTIHSRKIHAVSQREFFLPIPGVLPVQSISGDDALAECASQAKFLVAVNEVEFTAQDEVKEVFSRILGVTIDLVPALLESRLPTLGVGHV